MTEMDEMKQARLDAMKGSDAIVIVAGDYGYRVEQWLASGGLPPSSDYDTPQEAAARACQLLKLTEPVKPQDWPEIAQIGSERCPPPKP